MKLTTPSLKPPPLDAAGLNWFSNLKNQYKTLPTSTPRPDAKPQPPVAAPTAPDGKTTPLEAAANAPAPATGAAPADTAGAKNQTATTTAADSDVKKKASDAIDLILNKAENTLVTQDLFDLEDFLLPLLSGPALITRLKSLRDDYHEAFGDEKWKLIQPTLLPTVDSAKEDDIRAEARRLQEELHWQSSIAPWAAQTRESLMVKTLGIAVLVLVAMLLLAYWADNFVYVIVIAGLVGGAVSSIQRIQSANLASSRALALARHSSLNLGVVISPLLGGIFAIVLALMLMSKTVTPGAVVPKVEMGPGTNCLAACPVATNVANTVTVIPANQSPSPKPDEKAPTNTVAGVGHTETKNQPPQGFIYQFFSVSAIFAGGTDLALFMIWMFLAGFSERLVPDLLSKVAEEKKP